MNENKDMKELNLEELENVTGGMNSVPAIAIVAQGNDPKNPADPK